MARALLSVSDKTGVVDFAKGLENLGFEIISTGGTEKALREGGVTVKNVSEITGFPECLDGRVKTLHPAIHAGVLAMRSNSTHMEQLAKLSIEPIDVVAINLYPFKQTILKKDVTLAEAIENIDIGGPTMIRAAAKNYQDVVVVVDPSDYDMVLEKLGNNTLDVQTKFSLAYKVFEHTGAYDALIASYLRDKSGAEQFPDTISYTYEKAQELRYGENPHQAAVFYKETAANSGALPAAKQLHGKELSYNNINDTNGAIELLKEFDEPCVIGVKHANPCGVGIGKDIHEAYVKAYEADSVSIYGGIIAANREIDKATAEEIAKIFIEIVVAPSFSAEALEILEQKKNIRLLELPAVAAKLPKNCYDMKRVAGGLLVQERDVELFDPAQLKCVTERKPTEAEMESMLFGWKVVKHTKSNAIVLAQADRTVGVGPGQTNRVTALELAIKYAKDKAKGSVMASDAYFPFSDSVEAAHRAGVTAVIQPGGSIRDQDSIDLCNKYGMAMVFTGMRHFKH